MSVLGSATDPLIVRTRTGPLNLSGLQFGAPSAERDIAAGLPDYFIESQAFSHVAFGDKRIVIGNRGAGKSAIFKMVANQERLADNVVIELAPEDYSYQMFNDVLARESEGAWAKSGAYAAAWKYLILVLVMKKLARHARAKHKPSVGEKKMFAYLRDNHRNMAENPVDLLISYIKRMESLKIGKYEAGIKTRELTRLYKLEELEEHIPTVVNLCNKVQVSVLVDELDQGWDASEDAKSFVAGLFQACTWINRLSPRLRVFVSLRQELYENIPAIYDDTQKYRDLFQYIEWDAQQLHRLLTSRIRYFVPQLRLASDDDCWNAVFSEKRSFRYMIDRTLYRPREVIHYATDALDYVKSHSNRGPISQDVLQAIEPQHSRNRIQDLVAEYRFQYPGLQSVFDRFRGKRLSWRRSDLEDFCLDLALDLQGLSNEAKDWVADREPDSIIDILWRVGFMRVKTVERSTVDARYLSGSPADPTVSLSAADEFQISNLFKSPLSLHV